MQYLSAVTKTDRCSLSTKLTGNISDKLSSIFSVLLPSKPEWQSCIVFHSEIMYTYIRRVTWTPPKYAVFVPISPASTQFC